MNNLWDQRYARQEFVYGKLPNEFFRDQLLNLRAGKILLPAEGEGRNAVFAAKQGWKVAAFDSSTEAKKKALTLAAGQNVDIDFRASSFEEFSFEENYFDAIGLVYAHTTNRSENHRKVIRFLKPGGTIILEGFGKEQIQNNSGGPRSIDMLFSVQELEDDFKELTSIDIWEEDIVLSEGNQHSGKASVIRMVGIK